MNFDDFSGGLRSDASSVSSISDSIVGSSRFALLRPRHEALELDVGLLHDAEELLVVDDRLGVLALEHVDELRAGEHRVHEERVRAELRDGEDGLDEAAVVAGEDRDAVAFRDPLLGEGVGELVRALHGPLRR